MRYVEYVKQFFVPLEGVDIVKHRPRCVGRIGYVQLPVCQLPHELAINCAKGKFTVLCPLASTRDIVKQPFDLARAEIGIDLKARFLLDDVSVSFTDPAANISGPVVLPHDCIVNRKAGLSIPDNGCLALIGDADADDISGR